MHPLPRFDQQGVAMQNAAFSIYDRSDRIQLRKQRFELDQSLARRLSLMI